MRSDSPSPDPDGPRDSGRPNRHARSARPPNGNRTHATLPAKPFTAVILAGRRGGEDSLAQAAGASHRALLDIEGEPMLVRVVRRLLARPDLERLLINIDVPETVRAIPFIAECVEAGRLEVMGSEPSLSRSVLSSLEAAGLEQNPVLVTTADHALLDDAMLDAFFEAAEGEASDITLAMVPRRVIEARFPEAKRTYLRFKEDGFSGANLFYFRTPAAARVATFWQSVEQQRKQPWRLAHAFGWTSLALFLTRRLTLSAAMERASQVIGVRVRAVPLEIAEAAVDVDKIEDLELVREILAERARASA